MCKILGSTLESRPTTPYVARIKTTREVIRNAIRDSGTIRLSELVEQLALEELDVHQELAKLEREKRLNRFVVGTKIMLSWTGPESPDNT